MIITYKMAYCRYVDTERNEKRCTYISQQINDTIVMTWLYQTASQRFVSRNDIVPDSNVHGANKGPT